MSRSRRFFLFLSLILMVVFIPSAGRENITEPGYDNSENQIPYDFTPIAFWKLMHTMLFEIIYTLTQMAMVPIESLLPMKFLIYLGFRRISPKNVLGHTTRSIIYDRIAAQPGINFTALAHETGVNRGTLRYHLEILSLSGKIVALDEGEGCTRYFQDSGRFTLFEQHVIKHLGSEVRKKIILHLLSHPVATRQEVREVINITFPSVTWNMVRLCSDEIVRSERNGKLISYRINPDVRLVVEHFLGPVMYDPVVNQTDMDEANE